MPHPLVCDLYLSVSGQFRTESTCKYRIKDKKVSALRKELEERRRQHLQIEKIKEAKRQRFEAGMVVKRSEFERLKARSLHLASCLRRLDIRRDQISARQDSSISQAKCRVLRTYLLSLAYTVGDKYELIRKFGGMKNYLKMKVLIMHLETRRAVAQSISSILYMRIVPFEGQTMVLCIKQLGRGDKSYERVRIVSSLNPSQYSRTLFDEGVEICVYAVTGTNFCLKKVYNFEQLYKFADQLEEKLAPKSVAETREARFGVPKKRRKHRPSVAEYLLTRIRLQQQQHSQSLSIDNVNNSNTLSKISQQLASENNESSYNSSHQEDSNLDKCAHNGPNFLPMNHHQIANVADKNSKVQENNQTVTSYSPIVTQNIRIGSENVITVTEGAQTVTECAQTVTECAQTVTECAQTVTECAQTVTECAQTVTECAQTVTECAQTATEDGNLPSPNNSSDNDNFFEEPVDSSSTMVEGQQRPFAKKISSQQYFRKQFLQGREYSLFPVSNPLQNMVILKQTRQLLLLPEYLQDPDRLLLLWTTVRKLQLKMQLQKQLRKCILYKVTSLSESFESRIGQCPPKAVKVLYVLKENAKKDVHITCENIVSLQPEEAFVIKKRFHKDTSDDLRFMEKLKQEEKQAKRRNSKRKSSSKSSLKKEEPITIKTSEEFLKEMKEKFWSFLDTHLISVKLKKFMKIIDFSKHSGLLGRVQAHFRGIHVRKWYQKADKVQIQCRYDAALKILVSCMLYPDKVVVTVEFLARQQADIETLSFNLKYYKLIVKLVMDSVIIGSVPSISARLHQCVSRQIDKHQSRLRKLEEERPQRCLNLIVKFLQKIKLKLKSQRNIFFLQKLNIKSQWYVLILRRNIYQSCMLHCDLYELSSSTSLQKVNQKASGKIQDVLGGKVQDDLGGKGGRCFKYSTIYLKEQHFTGMCRQKISEQFLIGKRVFLLKPALKQSISYIQRLWSIDINCDQIHKEISDDAEEGEEEQLRNEHVGTLMTGKVLPKKKKNHDLRLQKKVSIDHGTDLWNIMEDKLCLGSEARPSNNFTNEQIGQGKGGLWTPLDDNQLLNDSTVPKKSEALKKTTRRGNHSNLHRSSGFSVHDSQANRPGKAVYHIAGNMHKSIVYYSLFKSQKDFFLDLFIVADEVNQQNQRYSQHLTLIQRERLSRKDFMESMNALVISRVIKWIRMHRGEVSTHATPHGKENISGIQINTFNQFDDSFAPLLCFDVLAGLLTPSNKKRLTLGQRESAKLVPLQEKRKQSSTFSSEKPKLISSNAL